MEKAPMQKCPSSYKTFEQLSDDNTPEAHAEFGEFITGHWHNLDTVKNNIENFKEWMKEENEVILP